MVRLAVATEVLEETIGSLRGVQGAKVIQSALGEIEEVHVLIDAERSPKQAVRDVESVLLARHNIELDHRKISVAQLNMAPVARTASKGRLKFVGASIGLRRDLMRASVELEREGEIYSSSAEGVYSPTKRPLLIAQATVGAVQQAGDEHGSLSVEDVAQLELGGKEVIVVIVKEVTDGSEISYAGSAVCKQDADRAVVSATLSALNRRLVREC